MRDAFRERRQRRLRRRVRTLSRFGCTHDIRRHIGDDSGSTREHAGHHRERAGHRTEEIHVEHVSIWPQVHRRSDDRRRLFDTGVVHEHVDATEARHDAIEHLCERVGIADVTHNGVVRVARSTKLVAEFLQQRLAARHPDDRSTPVCEVDREPTADTGGRAGDHHNRIVIAFHQISFAITTGDTNPLDEPLFTRASARSCHCQ